MNHIVQSSFALHAKVLVIAVVLFQSKISATPRFTGATAIEKAKCRKAECVASLVCMREYGVLDPKNPDIHAMSERLFPSKIGESNLWMRALESTAPAFEFKKKDSRSNPFKKTRRRSQKEQREFWKRLDRIQRFPPGWDST
ncbi:hypothetical protein [Crateriforma conspicua]|uniref:Uncharacterized protein n=1 Tax=Crateriforma conspicua TaxID=2527996 RepID=A0A5C6FX23_9PLAN|nr:hypothetical protein [Crateriforma conspicua]TWU66884.1 hypothetical protein V7x_24550 [Crateriforma conspicua]